MARALESMMRGLMGQGRGIGGGVGKISQMPNLGGMSGQGGSLRSTAQQIALPTSSGTDPLTNPNSPLAVFDDLLKGKLKEWFPTPQEQQAKTNADLFAKALVGEGGNQGLLGAQITPELLATAAGNMRQAGADAQGILDLVSYAVPAMNQQQELGWRKQRAEAEDKKLEAWLANMNAKTASTKSAQARANAKAGGANPDIW